MNIECAAILFDSDGVLVDSDASVTTAWRRWAHEYRLAHVDIVSMVHGTRSADTVNALIDEPDRVAALAAIDRYEIEDARMVTALPGALEMLQSMPVTRHAVVTSARRDLAVARLSAAGLPLPAVLVAAEDVDRGKPDPFGYLAAAAALDTPATDCVAVEDSVSGVAAARAAGVGAVIGIGVRALDTDADVVVPDLSALSWTANGVEITSARLMRAVAGGGPTES